MIVEIISRVLMSWWANTNVIANTPRYTLPQRRNSPFCQFEYFSYQSSPSRVDWCVRADDGILIICTMETSAQACHWHNYKGQPVKVREGWELSVTAQCRSGVTGVALLRCCSWYRDCPWSCQPPHQFEPPFRYFYMEFIRDWDCHWQDDTRYLAAPALSLPNDRVGSKLQVSVVTSMQNLHVLSKM